MNNKGFAISTIIYTSIVLLSLVMFTSSFFHQPAV